MESEAVHISDLFGNSRTVLSTGRPLDERAMLVKYFCDEIGRAPRYMGVRLAHFTLSELYAVKSGYLDRTRRPCALCIKKGWTQRCDHSDVTARKYFWWATRTHEATT